VRTLPIANPPNPYHLTTVDYEGQSPQAEWQVFEDATKNILSKNDSPDIPFTYSVNPYRGCQHGCSYCYARPSHEYLGFGAGTDFETKIVAKPDAPALLRGVFEKPSWKGEPIVFSGVTDCYQPLESTWRLTRGCLEVCAEFKNPVGIITKAPLVERDIDLLAALGARVTISIPFWDPEKARAMEPYAATPQRRMRTIERLTAAGISVGVNVAPVIPGLTDEDIPEILAAARAAGASRANFIMLRLPGPVAPVFEDRIRASFPLRAEKILNRVRETRGGKLYDSRFGARMRGEGEYASIIQALFDSNLKKLGYPDDSCADERPTTFRRPPRGQLSLF
jgi:DNA repair photolyase